MTKCPYPHTYNPKYYNRIFKQLTIFKLNLKVLQEEIQYIQILYSDKSLECDVKACSWLQLWYI